MAIWVKTITSNTLLWIFMFCDLQERQTKCRVFCICYAELSIYLTKWQKFIQHIQYTGLFDKYFIWQVKQTISMSLKCQHHIFEQKKIQNVLALVQCRSSSTVVYYSSLLEVFQIRLEFFNSIKWHWLIAGVKRTHVTREREEQHVYWRLITTEMLPSLWNGSQWGSRLIWLSRDAEVKRCRRQQQHVGTCSSLKFSIILSHHLT